MKRSIFLDRIRRKHILKGDLPDFEHLQNLDMDKKENNQTHYNDLLKQLHVDKVSVFLDEKVKNLNLYFFENAYVCCRCYRLY